MDDNNDGFVTFDEWRLVTSLFLFFPLHLPVPRISQMMLMTDSQSFGGGDNLATSCAKPELATDIEGILTCNEKIRRIYLEGKPLHYLRAHTHIYTSYNDCH